jgi:hypothetical protein
MEDGGKGKDWKISQYIYHLEFKEVATIFFKCACQSNSGLYSLSLHLILFCLIEMIEEKRNLENIKI